MKHILEHLTILFIIGPAVDIVNKTLIYIINYYKHYKCTNSKTYPKTPPNNRYYLKNQLQNFFNLNTL